MIKNVEISKKAQKQLQRLPSWILKALKQWIEDVEEAGLLEIRKIPGYHDEPLQGMRFGQRSIRLNKAYRAIYVVKGEYIKFVSVEEVSKHGY